MLPLKLKQKLNRKLNVLLYQTEWYKSFFLDIEHEIYPDNTWYRNHDERNYDLVNLGSSGGKWAFDYSGLTVKAMNMPFTGVNKQTGLYDAMKYLKLNTQGEPIEPHMYWEAQQYANNPLLLGKKKAIKTIIRHLRGREVKVDKIGNAALEHNPMSEDRLKQDADMWMAGWKHQFSIDDFEAPLTSQNQLGRTFRVRIMRELVDFCFERGYKPVYVIPPVTKFLAEKFTTRFREIYIYDYLKEVERNITLLDYSNVNELMASELYFNSFFLNAKGRKVFTNRVLNDIGLI